MFAPHASLDHRVALVTGASRKLGSAIASALIHQGIRVAINYNTSASEAHALVEAAASKGVDAVAIQGDLSDTASITRLVDKTLETFGTLDILVNNFGPYTDVPFSSLRPEDWDWIMNTNLKAAYYASQLAIPSMKSHGWGRIVSISAGSAFVRNHSVYGLAKNALLVLTESLALDFAPQVTVNSIAPGLIEDPTVPAEIMEAVRQDTPLRRLVTYQEVANMVCLLCSPAFDTVTGQVILMDGGQVIPRGMTFAENG
jgi:NAD(P)-dependent dehydrogenase (short-subunit alcohol dehydrogenase family)